uniref:Uncharacterized protein n=1 Tax=Kalanchoe fedtschenkoi TaxID=63787 RepID=A0A7N0VDZ2_KALFE
MGRKPCCPKTGVKKGAWTASEDKILTGYITAHGEGKWRDIPKLSGLQRCGKSCRLRWLNYLRPDIKRGNISADEEDLIIRLHRLLGNRWSLIAGRLPGRTDNEIKNYWNTHHAKKLAQPVRNNRQNVSLHKNSSLHKPAEAAFLGPPNRTSDMNNVAKAKHVESCFVPVPAMPWRNGSVQGDQDCLDVGWDFELGDISLCGDEFDWIFSDSEEVHDFHGTEAPIRSESPENLGDYLENRAAGQKDYDGVKPSSSAAAADERTSVEDWAGYFLLTSS